jgi:lycopene beta-cyclase
MRNEEYFRNKRILILEKSAKDQNDRTYCFWEKGEGLWDKLLRQSWLHGDFYSQEKSIPLTLSPYRYKMLHALDFYSFAKAEIAASPMFHWQNEDVLEVENGEPIRIIGKQGIYTAEYVFDSRIPEDFSKGSDKYTRLLQHFKGWVIRTPEDRFDPERFAMMDFRLLWPESTSFTYVLPLSKREALIEFTLFSPSLLNDSDYDLMLQRYVSDILKLQEFEIVQREQGVIPMSDFPFEKYSQGKHIRIGTAGGWVKPSTGYSFKNCERNSRKIVENLKRGRPANKGLIPRKFRFYDSLFIDVLNGQNELGPELFETLYSKRPVQEIFAFLDDQSSLKEDLSILVVFPWKPFLHSLVKRLTR